MGGCVRVGGGGGGVCVWMGGRAPAHKLAKHRRNNDENGDPLPKAELLVAWNRCKPQVTCDDLRNRGFVTDALRSAPPVGIHLRKSQPHKGTARIAEEETCSPKSSRKALHAITAHRWPKSIRCRRAVWAADLRRYMRQSHIGQGIKGIATAIVLPYSL